MAIPYDPKEIRDALEREVVEIVAEDAESVTRAVVLSTPVGNPALWVGQPAPDYRPGTHRGNWQVVFGRGDAPFLDVRDPVGGTTISRAFGRIREWAVPRGAGRRPLLTIQNAGPAIVPLNMGSSTQAPAGFIELAVQAGTRRPVPNKELP